ncbi:MAG: DUF4421 domain-containing protein [Saprospiraceae bacterium]|nr:DUF4421 domain-containing protein [Saprospiraceae bacterium]
MKYRICFHIIIALLLLSNFSFLNGQDSVAVKVLHNSSYVKDYSDLLCVKLFGINKSNNITHFDHRTQQSVTYKPNENFNVGLGFVHKWLGFDLAFNLPFINDDDDIYGESKRLDLQVNAYLRQFVIDFHYQRYQGFYAVKPWLFDSRYNLGDLVFPIRPDIRTFNTAVNIVKVFNPDKFSYKAAFIYNQRQLKSAGSWLAGGYLAYFTMDADSTIVPDSDLFDFDASIDFRGAKYVNTGLSGGYGHTFVVGEKFFFSLSIVVGMGPTFITTPENSMTEDFVEFAIRGTFRTAIGWNSKENYFGISAVSTNSSQVDIENSWLSRGVNNVKVFYGRRFNTSGFLKKVKDKPF